jgi:glycosyltransferase involved in cell wall biosynthesis
MNRAPERPRHRTLVLSWHPEDGYLSAGGFRRAREIVGRAVAESELVVLDNAPSIYRDLDRPDLVEYTVPHLHHAARLDSRLARAVQWSVASAKLVSLGLRSHRRRRYDALYVPTSELLVCTLPAVVLKMVTRRRLVLCNQNVEGVFGRRLTLFLHNRADLVTTVSEALRDALVAAGVRTRIEVTRNGAPTVEGELAANQASEKTWDGIFIGRHTAEKGIFDALEIWRRVCDRRPGARLVLVGACAPETKRRIETLKDALGTSGEIELAGVVSDRRKFELLRASRVLLAPSRVEGWGFVPLEALYAGVPVVCWDLAAYRESLPDVNAVARVAAGDLDLFTDRVLEALEGSIGAAEVIPKPGYGWRDVAAREWAAVVREAA